jgi:hypothetical protein
VVDDDDDDDDDDDEKSSNHQTRKPAASQRGALDLALDLLLPSPAAALALPASESWSEWDVSASSLSDTST